MALIDDLRKELPEYADLADHEVVTAVSRRLGEDPAAVAGELGIQFNEPGFKTGLKSGLASYATGVGRLAEDAGMERIGRGLRHFGEDVQYRNPTTVHSFEQFAESPWQGWKELTGQAIGSTLPALIPYVGQAGRVASAAAGTAIGAAPAYGGIRETQQQTGQEDIPAALAGAFATGAIEQLGGIQRVLRPATGGLAGAAREFASTPMRTAAKQGLRTMAEEGLEEVGQNPIQQYAGGLDPTAPEQLMDTAFSGFAGVVGATPFGGFAGARAGMQHRAAQGFVQENLLNPAAPVEQRMAAVDLQSEMLGGDTAWADNMRLGIQEDLNRERANVLAQGAPLNLLNVQGDLAALEQYQPAVVPDAQGSIFDTINRNQDAVVALPHAAPAMPVGTEVEPPINRAASIFAALHGQQLNPGSQEAQDYAWAEDQLKGTMSPAAYAEFAGQLAIDKVGQKSRPAPKVAQPNVAPAVVTSRAGVPSGPAGAAPQSNSALFKSLGGRVTHVAKALDQAKTPEESVEIVRQWIEKPNIASSTLRALEEMHKQLTGKTYEIYLREQEAAEAAPAPTATAPTVDYVLKDIGPHEPDVAGRSYADQMRAGTKRVTYFEPGQEGQAELDALVEGGLATKRDYKLHGQYDTAIYAMNGAEQEADALVQAFDRMSEEGETPEIADAIGAALGYTPEQRKSYINRMQRYNAGEWVQDWAHTPERPSWIRTQGGKSERSAEVNPYVKGAPNARQSVSRQAVPPRNGQAPGAQPGKAVQQVGAAGQRAEEPNRQGTRQVSTSAQRAQLAETVVKSLRPQDQEVLGFMQQHGEKAFELLGQKWGITRQAARQRVFGQRTRDGSLVLDPRSGTPKQLGIVDRISNVVAKHGLTVEDLMAGFKPRVFESDAARTGLSPKLNESVHETDVQQEEAAVEQSSGSVASVGGSQSNWKDGNSRGENWLRENDPEYAGRPSADVTEPEQEVIPAAQGEKVDERITERDAAAESYSRGQQWWDTERDGAKDVPAFEDLSDRHQEEVIDAVTHDDADGRLQKRIVAEFNDPSYFSRGKALRESAGLTDEEQTHPGVQRALQQLRDSGLLGLLDLARNIYVSRGMKGLTTGLFTPHEDRSFSVALSHELFAKSADPYVSDPNLLLAHVIRHELAHGMDFAVGRYSGSNDMIETVVPEMTEAVSQGGPLAEYLEYPFDRAAHEITDDVEFRAELFAQLQSAWLTETGRSLIQRAAPRTAQFLRNVNEHAKAQLRRKAGVPNQAAEGALEGAAASRGQVGRVLRHRAFHGTPHSVHESGGFSLEKVGTGEGAQAYGWGLYFASNKKVAQWYKTKLTDTQERVYYKGSPLPTFLNKDSSIKDRVVHKVMVATHGRFSPFQSLVFRRAVASVKADYKKAYDIAKSNVEFASKIPGAEKNEEYFLGVLARVEPWYQAAQELDAADFRAEKSKGRLYEVELAPQESEYMDWDKPIARQSESVRQAFATSAPLQEALAAVAEDFPGSLGPDQSVPASRVYEYLAKQLSKQVPDMPAGVTRPDEKAASLALLAAGVPGIKYHDAGSRGFQGNGQFNYVIFDDKLVSIKSYENRGKSIEDFQASLKTMPDQELYQTVDMLREAREKGDKTAQERWLAARQEIDARRKTRLFRDVQEKYGNGDENPPTLQNRGRTIEAASRAQVEATTRLGDLWAKAKPTLLTLHQLVDQYGSKLKGLKDYVASMGKMEQRHQEILNRAHSVIMDWQSLPTRTRDQLHQVMQRATMRGVHPDEPFGTGPNAHLTDQSEYDAIKARYDQLPAEAKATYKAVRKMLDANWAARRAAFSRTTTAAYQKLIDEAAGDQKQVTALEKERDQLISDHDKAIAEIKGPYFPLLRFGDYLMIARSKDLQALVDQLEDASGTEATALRKRIEAMQRDGNHYVVEAYENRYEAENSAGQHQSRGMVARAQLAEEQHRALQPVAAGAIDKISSRISDQFDKDTASKMKRLVTELYISSLPEHAALQRQLKRKGIEGATTDMLRAVAKAVEKDAFHLARLEYADQLADQLFKVKQEAKKAGIDSQHVYNNLAARLALDFDWKPTPIQSALARISGIWHLGMSPAYLLTNSTQPWMITAPVLAGRFGAGRAFAALRSAWVDAANVIRASKKAGAFADIDFKSVPDAQEREMLERIVSSGQIDITQNVDMGLVADGTDPRFLKLQKAFNWTNQHIEVSNRITSALAGYRLSRQRGMSHEDAAEFAQKVVVDTQLDYSNANAAYWMKSGAVPLGKLIFQFRKYQQGMLYLLARNAQQAFKGDKDAMRSLGYLMAMQLAFAGAVGIPAVTAPLAALGMFTGDDDEKGDPETQIRNYLTDLMGADAARAFWKGLPTLMGLDVSQRVGMGDIWKPLPYLRLTGKTGRDDMAQLLLATLGAPFGTISNAADSMNFFGKGDWAKGVERLLPKMLADPLRAARYAGEGLTARSGNQVLTPEKIDGWDVAFRAAGFSPTVESEHYAAQRAKEDVAGAMKERRAAALAKYAQARLRGEDTTSQLEAINRYNADHPTQRISRSDMLQAVQARRTSARQLDGAGVQFAKRERPLREITRFAQ